MKVIWCVTDNKPGHLSQLNGLLEALKKCLECRCYFVETSGSLGDTNKMAKPDIILCAGHRTHWRAIALSWRFKAKLIVLMNPSLPKFLFDVCIIPQHDGVADKKNIITTKGALNTVELQSNATAEQGLILIGGPSKHYRWDNTEILNKLNKLCSLLPTVNWVLTTSRRTPKDLLPVLTAAEIPNLDIVPVEHTDGTWLQEHYQKSARIWVTEDSASMVYESLSTGAQVGVIEVPRVKNSRIARGVDQLIEEKYLNTLLMLEEQGAMFAAKSPLREADRVAELLIQNFL